MPSRVSRLAIGRQRRLHAALAVTPRGQASAAPAVTPAHTPALRSPGRRCGPSHLGANLGGAPRPPGTLSSCPKPPTAPGRRVRAASRSSASLCPQLPGAPATVRVLSQENLTAACSETPRLGQAPEHGVQPRLASAAFAAGRAKSCELAAAHGPTLRIDQVRYCSSPRRNARGWTHLRDRSVLRGTDCATRAPSRGAEC